MRGWVRKEKTRMSHSSYPTSFLGSKIDNPTNPLARNYIYSQWLLIIHNTMDFLIAQESFPQRLHSHYFFARWFSISSFILAASPDWALSEVIFYFNLVMSSFFYSSWHIIAFLSFSASSTCPSRRVKTFIRLSALCACFFASSN